MFQPQLGPVLSNQSSVRVSSTGERPNCVQISVDTEKAETSRVALEFALEKHPGRFLTKGGETAINSAYENLPVNALVDKGKFLSAHAAEYCDQKQGVSHTVTGCLDSPPFVLNIKVSPAGDPDWRFWALAGGVIAGGVLVSALTTSLLQSHLKTQ